jgi:hypothetical protein
MIHHLLFIIHSITNGEGCMKVAKILETLKIKIKKFLVVAKDS